MHQHPNVLPSGRLFSREIALLRLADLVRLIGRILTPPRFMLTCGQGERCSLCRIPRGRIVQLFSRVAPEIDRCLLRTD